MILHRCNTRRGSSSSSSAFVYSSPTRVSSSSTSSYPSSPSWRYPPAAPTSTRSSLKAAAIVPETRSVTRLFSSTSSSSTTTEADFALAVERSVSRLDTLQQLLTLHGAPGSIMGTTEGDFEAVFAMDNDDDDDTTTTSSSSSFPPFVDNLHPHLMPIAESKSSPGHYICALRRAYANDQVNYQSSSNAPWPIVESAIGKPGMRLLALNSELYMRRMAAEADAAGTEHKDEILTLYNQGLGQGFITDKGLDQVYEAGAVEQLGYGVEKYTLLKIGPFPDLYEQMMHQHLARGDEESAMIAAEAANGKFVGFGSTFATYAQLLNSLLVGGSRRTEEARDAARMCLRLPIPSIGMDVSDLSIIAVHGQLLSSSDNDVDDNDDATRLAAMKDMYEKIRQQDEGGSSAASAPPGGANDKSPEQKAIDDANYLLDTVALTAALTTTTTEAGLCDWASIRSQLADIYASVGRTDMETFVDPTRLANTNQYQ